MSDRNSAYWFNRGAIDTLEYLADIYEDIKYTDIWNQHTCTKCLELDADLDADLCKKCRNA